MKHGTGGARLIGVRAAPWQQPGERAKLTGGEQLALVVTWGLMNVDITAPSSEWQGQPRDEQPRYLPGLDDSSPTTLTGLFVMLTGAAPLSPGAVANTGTI